MHELTERHREVLQLADRGMDDPAIAGELGVGVSTVLSHWQAVYAVLHVEKGDHRRERAIFTWRQRERAQGSE